MQTESSDINAISRCKHNYLVQMGCRDTNRIIWYKYNIVTQVELSDINIIF